MVVPNLEVLRTAAADTVHRVVEADRLGQEFHSVIVLLEQQGCFEYSGQPC